MNTGRKVFGAAAAFLIVYLLRRYFGIPAALVFLVVLLLAWWLLYLYTQRRFDEVYSQFQRLDAEQKELFLGKLDPEIRKDIEERLAREQKR
jgi:hypothetical protein